VSGPSTLVVGTGFLGRALALALARRGAAVTVLSPRADAQSWPSGIAAVRGRQEDAALLAGLLAGHATVIHAAWGTTPASSAGRPAFEAEQGLNPFLAFLETLQRFPDLRVLFLSSGGTVYGDPAHLPVREEAPLQPRSCHGAGKAAAECFLSLRAPEKTLVLRPSNIYGPGQPLRSGFGVVRHLLDCAAGDRPFTLLGDGMQVRDYLYIEDFVEATCRLALHPAAGVFNLGSGTGTALSDLIRVVEQVTGRTIRIERRPARGSDVARIVLDTERIRRVTGWAPSVGLYEGVARAWRAIGQ
jgi:UDP-glucose 4-epimerase